MIFENIKLFEIRIKIFSKDKLNIKDVLMGKEKIYQQEFVKNIYLQNLNGKDVLILTEKMEKVIVFLLKQKKKIKK